MERRVARGALSAIWLLTACSAPVATSPPPASTPTDMPTPAPSPTQLPLTGWAAAAAIDGVQADLRSVTQFDGRLFAAGAIKAAGVTEGAVLASVDGSHWEIVAGAGELGAGVFLRDITASDTGLLVGGTDNELDVVATWFSPDGATWTRSTLPGSDRTNPLAVAERSGVWVVGGTLTDSAGELAIGPRVWSSEDGLTWRGAEGPRIEGEYGRISGLAASADGFVAIGDDYYVDPSSSRV